MKWTKEHKIRHSFAKIQTKRTNFALNYEKYDIKTHSNRR